MNIDTASLITRLTDIFGKPNLTPLYEEIGQILLTSVARNFREGGRYSLGEDGEWVGGTQSWITSGRAERDSGQTLSDTGILASSITADVSASGVTIGTNLVYAAIHQFGGKAGRKVDGENTVALPARPYLVVQEEDIDSIVEATEEFFRALIQS